MIKNAFWNALSILVFVAIFGVVAVFSFLYFQPYSSLNPFPPPTVPAALNLPTLTPTYPQLPPTWTPPSPNQAVSGPTLRPSSTLLVQTNSFVLINSKTPVPTRTPTATPTATATATEALSRTPTGTPNQTHTALALTVTSAARTAAASATSQAKTATALAGGPGSTQTVEAMPPNPASAVETNGATSDTWQRTVSDPAFTWTPAVGANGYYVYWGTDPAGVSTSKVTAAAYDPAAVAPGAYYLRVRTTFPWGERPNWTTIFIFRYDNTQPAPPSSAVETHGAPNGVWQNTVADPAFTWTAADTGSGIVRYDVYLGSNPGGTYVVAQPTTAAYDPAALISGNYYLRVRSVDAAQNTSDWVTLFQFRYDGTPPSAPSGLQTADPPSDATPTFTWSPSSDAHSGLAAYEVFWGPGTTCGAKNQSDQLSPGFTVPAVAAPGDYTLCVRARDNTGNTSDWAQAGFTYTP